MKYSKYCIVSFLFTVITHRTFSQIISSSCKTDWSLAGYQGSIPVYPVVKNINDYGGSGNGVTANDAALQNAISSLNNQNGTIYFPAGTFLFNVPIILRSGLVLKGEGAVNTILKFNLSGTGSLITVAGNSSATISGLTSAAWQISLP